MQLQGMSDQQFETMVQATERGDAHSFTNFAESRNSRNWRMLQRGLVWVAKRDEPQLSDYPEVTI